MKIKAHSESHIVELDDGSHWQIFPGDLDATLNWTPETELTVLPFDDEISSHMLVNGGVKVHAIAAGESWPVKEVKSVGKVSQRPSRLSRETCRGEIAGIDLCCPRQVASR